MDKRRKRAAAFGWRGWLFEGALWTLGRPEARKVLTAEKIQSIFVLRNNDLGDLLVTTPLFQALHERFPEARIVAGVGDWGRGLLENNPFVSEVVPINAPWANKFVAKQTPMSALSYIFKSLELQSLRNRRFDVGIDIFGSGFGALLLLQAGVSYRIGIEGPHGGWSSSHWLVPFDEREHVSAANLRIAQHLKPGTLPAARPQLFLSGREMDRGESFWPARGRETSRVRVVIGPGAGLPEKCWPLDRLIELANQLEASEVCDLLILGGLAETVAGEAICAGCSRAVSLAGKLTLRETLAAVAQADLVISHSTMLMHVAAAFEKKLIVLLTPIFPSATAHEALWGYPDLGPTIGGGAREATVGEVIDAFAKTIRRVQPTPA